MDPDSLDWIWEKSNNSSKPGEIAIAGEFDDGDSDIYDHSNDENGSDTSSDSSIGCSLLIGDMKTVQQLNEIVYEVKKQNVGKGNDEISGSTIVDDLGDELEDYESNIDTFYDDALEVTNDKLSEVRQLWTDALYICTVNEKNIPESYTKTTSVEKLVLLYARNFIERFKFNYPNRQLILLHKNEYDIQKCVCTTIKPSRLVYHNLNDLDSYSQFVAKHITYVKLEDPLVVPNKLMSPTMTLNTQSANCFELATLLVSFLIGCEYNAFVVQGYATENVCNNDLEKIELELPKLENENSESKNMKPTKNHVVKPMYNLCSEYVRFLIEDEKNKSIVQNEVKENDFSHSDPLYGMRVHCWVLVIMQLEIEDENSTKKSFFIEPSTGERQDICNKNYIGIESIWNHKNYWVNLQSLERRYTYNFNLINTKCWECFLPDKPHCSLKDIRHNGKETTRPITMPNSWVNVLEIPRNKYLMLYPTGKKIVYLKNAVKEYYTEYAMPDGLIEKTTFFAEPGYKKKTFVKEIYNHRVDKLIGIETIYTLEKIETTEYFSRGRKDCLKVHKYCGDGNILLTDRSIIFYNLRLDSMTELNIDANSFVTLFKDRSDLLFQRTCTFHKTEEYRHFNIKRKPMNIVEKYLRDESKDKDKDIATIQFNFVTNKIYVQYQYGEGQITQSSRLFTKPSNVISSDTFDPESIIENIVYPYEGHLKPYEAYILLQDMIKAENEAFYEISKLEDVVLKIMETRSYERSEFKLKVDSLDWDRNHKIRKLLQNEKDKKIGIAKQDNAKQTEYALPYSENIKKQSFTHNTALDVRDKIINDFRQNTKYQFISTKRLFMEKQFEFKSLMTKTLEIHDFKDLKLKNKMIILCSMLKYKLDVLMLKMERYRETHVQRYNNLASYLNSNPHFKTLLPLKLFNLND